ncbi:MAG: hypothetical protein MUF66_06965, partial [Gammaproteobacteria bacterium]|nr:hypothetical protein [Gammaproteobacteria bacterium]
MHSRARDVAFGMLMTFGLAANALAADLPMGAGAAGAATTFAPGSASGGVTGMAKDAAMDKAKES